MTINQIVAGQHRLTIGDEQITINPITLEREAEFESRHLQLALNALEKIRPLLAEKDHTKQLAEITNNYALGGYRLIGKDGSCPGIQSLIGMSLLSSVLTGIPEIKCEKFLNEKSFGQMLALVLKESIGILKK